MDNFNSGNNNTNHNHNDNNNNIIIITKNNNNNNDDDEEENDDNIKDPGMLLNLSQKSTIFVADQTPTPTRLIKNCEEVGLFDDLRHVNPFEETFRQACERSVLQNPASQSAVSTTTTITSITTDEESSLHTPQVFPQFDIVGETGLCERDNDLTKHALDIPTTVLDSVINPIENNIETINSTGATAIAAIPSPNTPSQALQTTITTTMPAINFVPSAAQFIQQQPAQMITVTFPTTIHQQQQQQQQQHYKPEQISAKVGGVKSKPLLLPKLNRSATDKTTVVISNKHTKSPINTTPTVNVSTLNNNCNNNEPSSASLTPTSQLPIKERLKAILNQNGKSQLQEWPIEEEEERKINNNNTNKDHAINNIKILKIKSVCNENKNDTMERRRAASSRYRHKIRNEHQELKKHNAELQLENENLKKRIKYLEMELNKLQTIANNKRAALDTNNNDDSRNFTTQLQIPASTIHLVMNIPKMMIPFDHNYHYHNHTDNYL